MPETKQPIFATKVRKWCNSCFQTANLTTGEGEMIFTGVFMGKKHKHLCNKCSQEQWYTKMYPYMELTDNFKDAPFIYDEPRKKGE
jgi:hypothetical protein